MLWTMGAVDFSSPLADIDKPSAADLRGTTVDPKTLPDAARTKLEKFQTVIGDNLREKVVLIKAFPFLSVRSLYIIDTYRLINGAAVRVEPTRFDLLPVQSNIGGTVFAIFLPILIMSAISIAAARDKTRDKAMLQFALVSPAIMALVIIIAPLLSWDWAIIASALIMAASGLYFGGRALPLWGACGGAFSGLFVGMFIGDFAGAMGAMQAKFFRAEFNPLWEYAAWYAIFCLAAVLIGQIANHKKASLSDYAGGKKIQKMEPIIEMATMGSTIDMRASAAAISGEMVERSVRRKKKKE